MLFNFKISSKSEQTLNKFAKFVSRLETLPITVKHFSKRNKKKFFTVLKSPHVNKTAQEQFEFRFYHKEFFLDSLKPLTTLVLFKKTISSSFPGVKMKVENLSCHKRKKFCVSRALNPETVVLSRSFFVLQFSPFAQKKYLQLFDCYGESCLQDLTSRDIKNNS